MSVLVTYATAFGSTREIAERVGEVIGKWVPSAVVRPVDEMDTVAGYDAIVVGSAVHNQVWLPEAREFVRRNAADLSDRPVWTFSVGMPGALPRLLRRMAMSEEAILRAQFKGVVGPVGHHLFSGVVTPECLPRIGRVIFRLIGGRYGDHRDWHEIEAWADGIGQSVAATPPPAEKRL
ncbi:flavodoxin domain-containing protein [Actinocrinis sp.]|uniref:flavodoxin domain-containing protein n=1 Tax=Actinocrinis sp. TaxID=1920516 RepID=UPI002D3E2037|nr:flavodoxin domain-containing protein [Actinocrinis sp.]HZP54582.1 flavodoxin domain-containing protein [Actinocrinis sp.]